MFPLKCRKAVAIVGLISAAAFAQTDYTNAYSITTAAGHALAGVNRDGVAEEAEIGDGNGVAIDRDGNLYVADGGHHTIRKISPSGVVSTLAGKADAPGTADGIGLEAQFNYPDGVALDAAGNLFVADRSNHAIRKITPPGVVTTFAGKTGSPGSQDGVGGGARFYEPSGLAFDQQGNLYVAESANDTIRKITPGGVVTTLAGHPGWSGSADGVGDAARFSSPHGLAVDGAGTVYVADSNSFTIRKISPEGVVSTLAGLSTAYGSTRSSIDGTGTAAHFYNPYNLALGRDGALYVTDNYSHTLRRVTMAGVVVTVAGKSNVIGSVDGLTSVARFNYPSGVAVDAAGGLVITDSANHSVRRVAPDGMVSTLVGRASLGSNDGPAAQARFYGPAGVVDDGLGNCYVADRNNQVVRRLAADGTVSTVAGAAGESGSTDGAGAVARFNLPAGIARDRAGNLYVADSGNHSIRKISAAGIVTTLAGQPGVSGSADGTVTQTQFRSPCGVTVDREGNVYVADTGNSTIRKITASGVVTTLAGQAPYYSPGGPTPPPDPGYGVNNVDGLGSAARFNAPSALSLDGLGNLYVADRFNATIRKVTPGGEVSTLAGKAGDHRSVDGGSSNARFNFPTGIAVDDVGHIYVSDSFDDGPLMDFLAARNGGQTIRRISRDGVVNTVAGVAATAGATDGSGSSAKFNIPSGLAVDWEGTVLVADTGNNTIRRGKLAQAAPTARLVNISARTFCGVGNNVTIGGFVISGAAKRVLVRAVGPTLSTLGLPGSEVLTDPTIELHHGDAVIATNDNWLDNAVAPEITTVGASLGATRLASTDTKSAALLLTLEPGVYSFVVTGKGGSSGIVLLEIYDAEPGIGGALTNISTRAFCGNGNAVTIGGLVIAGTGAKRVMLRAVGPTLARQGLGVSEVLADPTIELHQGTAIIAGNNDLGDSRSFPALASVGARLGATPLDATDAKSSAVLYALDTGVYSFVANGHDGASGVVLIEIYDAD